MILLIAYWNASSPPRAPSSEIPGMWLWTGASGAGSRAMPSGWVGPRVPRRTARPHGESHTADTYAHEHPEAKKKVINKWNRTRCYFEGTSGHKAYYHA